MSPQPARICVCPPELRKAALRVLHDGLPPVDQPGLIQALELADAADLAGLIVAICEDPVAAAWIQPAAGATAVVWPPPGASPHALQVLAAAARFVDQREFGLAQALISVENDPTGAALAAAGFPFLAELAYLYADTTSGAAEFAATAEFHPHAGDDPGRLAAVLERTYIGSQDIPALEASRSLADVIAGYRAQGEHLPEHWYFVRCESIDAGALLLASHADAGNWELVYMGVAPEFRGRRLGRQIVRKALAAAAQGGAERVVAAVDAANKPAVSMYRAAGFIEWDRRRVYARLRTKRATDHGESS